MKCLISAVLSSSLALMATGSNAADYSDDIHKNDYKWMQFNLMYGLKELPRLKDAEHDGHDYLEMEFGGRSGVMSLYGYFDVFNLTNSNDSDKKGASKMFMKLAPRFSLDGMTGKDLSFGPVKEVYFSTLFNVGGGSSDVNESNWGIGVDIDIPWLGTSGLNLMGTYNINDKEWDGFQLTGNWFKPFYFFENKSFLSYQGYFDYRFGADKAYRNGYQTKTETGFDWFNGIYWHSERFAAGYGLKYFHDVYTVKDGQPIFDDKGKRIPGAELQSTGFAHYFSVTYKL